MLVPVATRVVQSVAEHVLLYKETRLDATVAPKTKIPYMYRIAHRTGHHANTPSSSSKRWPPPPPSNWPESGAGQLCRAAGGMMAWIEARVCWSMFALTTQTEQTAVNKQLPTNSCHQQRGRTTVSIGGFGARAFGEGLRAASGTLTAG